MFVFEAQSTKTGQHAILTDTQVFERGLTPRACQAAYARRLRPPRHPARHCRAAARSRRRRAPLARNLAREAGVRASTRCTQRARKADSDACAVST